MFIAAYLTSPAGAKSLVPLARVLLQFVMRGFGMFCFDLVDVERRGFVASYCGREGDVI